MKERRIEHILEDFCGEENWNYTECTTNIVKLNPPNNIIRQAPFFFKMGRIEIRDINYFADIHKASTL